MDSPYLSEAALPIRGREVQYSSPHLRDPVSLLRVLFRCRGHGTRHCILQLGDREELLVHCRIRVVDSVSWTDVRVGRGRARSPGVRLSQVWASAHAGRLAACSNMHVSVSCHVIRVNMENQTLRMSPISIAAHMMFYPGVGWYVMSATTPGRLSPPFIGEQHHHTSQVEGGHLQTFHPCSCIISYEQSALFLGIREQVPWLD